MKAKNGIATGAGDKKNNCNWRERKTPISSHGSSDDGSSLFSFASATTTNTKGTTTSAPWSKRVVLQTVSQAASALNEASKFTGSSPARIRSEKAPPPPIPSIFSIGRPTEQARTQLFGLSAAINGGPSTEKENINSIMTNSTSTGSIITNSSEEKAMMDGGVSRTDASRIAKELSAFVHVADERQLGSKKAAEQILLVSELQRQKKTTNAFFGVNSQNSEMKKSLNKLTSVVEGQQTRITMLEDKLDRIQNNNQRLTEVCQDLANKTKKRVKAMEDQMAKMVVMLNILLSEAAKTKE